MRQTSAAPVKALAEEAAERQLKALPTLAKRELDEAEPDAFELLARALALPTRARARRPGCDGPLGRAAACRKAPDG